MVFPLLKSVKDPKKCERLFNLTCEMLKIKDYGFWSHPGFHFLSTETKVNRGALDLLSYVHHSFRKFCSFCLFEILK